MLINYLSPKRIEYDEIEGYNLVFTLCLAFYSYIITTVPNLFNLLSFTRIFFIYLCVDTLFIPNDRLDRYVHHFLSYVLISYATEEDLDVPHIHNMITIPFIKTEISTIFLTSSLLLKKYTKRKMLLNLSNIMLFYTFFKYRINNLTYAVYETIFNSKLILNNGLLSTIILLLVLNYIWQYKICMFFYKYYDINSFICRFKREIKNNKLIKSNILNCGKKK